jgi:hypothetical protein
VRTTTAADKLKQSVTPREDLSTFIPTPTWGSPRVTDLQPATLNSSRRAGLASRAAHAASLLAQAAANAAAQRGIAADPTSVVSAAADSEGAAAAEAARPAGGQQAAHPGQLAQLPARTAAAGGADGAGHQLNALMVHKQPSDDELVRWLPPNAA